MLVVNGLVHEAEGVAVVLAAAGESVVVVIEALPLVLHVVATEVGEVAIVQLRGLIEVATYLVEVEADGASQLSAVEEDEELWLHARRSTASPEGSYRSLRGNARSSCIHSPTFRNPSRS